MTITLEEYRRRLQRLRSPRWGVEQRELLDELLKFAVESARELYLQRLRRGTGRLFDSIRPNIIDYQEGALQAGGGEVTYAGVQEDRYHFLEDALALAAEQLPELFHRRITEIMLERV
ncbi:MAG: hypothetical protein AAFR76_01505 [Planctomycetota bacterium]